MGKAYENTATVISAYIVIGFLSLLVLFIHDSNGTYERKIHRRIRAACILEQRSLKTLADSINFTLTIPKKYDSREFQHSCVQIIAHEGESTWIF